MKTFIKLTFGIFLVLFFIGCAKNFDKINENPNNPAEVTTASLLTAAEKGLCDDIYDEWWGGRQSLLYAQYWCQRNYPSEDRYAIRQNTNSTYWRLIYHDAMILQQIINLNTDPETKAKAAASGDNNNQIACATILKIWVMQMMADTYGNIPYSEALMAGETPTPKYDALPDIYAKFLEQLAAVIGTIDEGAGGFNSGDVIYGGDMSLWKKFGNSLRLRIAMRMSGTESPKYKTANALVAEVGTDGFMTSNADNAAFAYIGATPNNSPLYDAFWTSARNDFTTCKTLVNLLKGVDDTLNPTDPAKINPFHGLVDPRLRIYSRPRGGKYIGMPYGMTEGQTQNYWNKKLCPSFYGAAAYNSATAPVILNAKFAPVYMEYAEVEFMLSELNNWDQSHYEFGIRASMEHWRDVCIDLEGWDPSEIAAYNTDMDAYIAAMPAANKTTVMTQKYLAFFNQGYQAWFEYNRTGEPGFLLRPGQNASVDADGNMITFIPLVTLTNLPLRMTYPQQEFTVNASSVTAAVAALGAGGDAMSTKLWWEP
jgi:hypothetical protein